MIFPLEQTPTDEMLRPLASAMCEERDEAVKCRKASGVEGA